MTAEELIRARVDLVQRINAHLAAAGSNGVIAITVQPNPSGPHLYVTRTVNVTAEAIVTAASFLCLLAADEYRNCQCGVDHGELAARLLEAARLITEPATPRVLN